MTVCLTKEYQKLLKERNILLAWYIQTLETYDGLTTRDELEKEVMQELQKAVEAHGLS